jgi:hypothetical protein
MKKKVKRSFPLILVLAFASLVSYIYLNTVDLPSEKADNQNTVENIDVNESENPEREILLLDVEIIKKVIRSSKKLFPTS